MSTDALPAVNASEFSFWNGALVDPHALPVPIRGLQRGHVRQRSDAAAKVDLHLDLAPLVGEDGAIHHRGRSPLAGTKYGTVEREWWLFRRACS